MATVLNLWLLPGHCNANEEGSQCRILIICLESHWEQLDAFWLLTKSHCWPVDAAFVRLHIKKRNLHWSTNENLMKWDSLENWIKLGQKNVLKKSILFMWNWNIEVVLVFPHLLAIKSAAQQSIIAFPHSLSPSASLWQEKLELLLVPLH